MNGHRQTIFLFPLVFVLVTQASAPGGVSRFNKESANEFMRVPPTAIVHPTYVITLYEGTGIDTSRGEHLARKFDRHLQKFFPRMRVELWVTEDFDHITSCKKVKNCEILGIYEEKHIENTEVGGSHEVVRKYEYEVMHKLPGGKPKDHLPIKPASCKPMAGVLNEESCRKKAFEKLAKELKAHDTSHHAGGQ